MVCIDVHISNSYLTYLNRPRRPRQLDQLRGHWGGRAVPADLGADRPVGATAWLSGTVKKDGKAYIQTCHLPNLTRNYLSIHTQAIDILGPKENTLSGPEMAAMVSRVLQGEEVRYEAVPVPTDDAYGGLWRFLRAGGFDAFLNAADYNEILGSNRRPRRLEDHIREALRGGGV
jgi:hypothetical protein